MYPPNQTPTLTHSDSLNLTQVEEFYHHFSLKSQKPTTVFVNRGFDWCFARKVKTPYLGFLFPYKEFPLGKYMKPHVVPVVV